MAIETISYPVKMSDAKTVLEAVATAAKVASEAHTSAVTSAVQAAWNDVHAKFALRMKAALGYGEGLYPKKSAAEIKELRALFPDCQGWVDGEFPVIMADIKLDQHGGKHLYMAEMRTWAACGPEIARFPSFQRFALTNFARRVETLGLDDAAAAPAREDVRALPAGDLEPLTHVQISSIHKLAAQFIELRKQSVPHSHTGYPRQPVIEDLMAAARLVIDVCPPAKISHPAPDLKATDFKATDFKATDFKATDFKEADLAAAKAELAAAKAELAGAKQKLATAQRELAGARAELADQKQWKVTQRAVMQDLRWAAWRIGEAADLSTVSPPIAKATAMGAVALLDDLAKK